MWAGFGGRHEGRTCGLVDKVYGQRHDEACACCSPHLDVCRHVIGAFIAVAVRGTLGHHSVQGVLGVQGAGCKVQVVQSVLWVQGEGTGCRVQGAGCRVQGVGCRV